jgi:hypothetical protein
MTARHVDLISILAFPLTLSVGIVLIPVVSDYADHALAAQAVAQTGRWFVGHLLAAVAFGLSIWAVSVIIRELSSRGYQTPALVLPLISVGAGLYAAGLGADGIGPVAVQASNLPVADFFDGSGWWVTGVFVAATILYGAGLIPLGIHAIRGELLTGVWRYVVFVSSLLFVAAPATPSGWALYGVAVASVGVFAPIGISLWRSA